MDTLHAVLRLLVEEQVSIRNLPLILESISEARLTVTQPEGICELVRQRLGFQLVADLKRPDGTIPLLQLAPEWEEAFAAHQVDTGAGGIDVALPPEQFNRLAGNLGERLNEISSRGITAALVTPVRRRRFLRTVMQAHGLSAP